LYTSLLTFQTGRSNDGRWQNNGKNWHCQKMTFFSRWLQNRYLMPDKSPIPNNEITKPFKKI